MSQHLLTEFINRTYVFKPFHREKLVSHSVKKYQGSNRKNHVSPEMVAQSSRAGLETQVKKINEEKQLNQDVITDKHVDITV